MVENTSSIFPGKVWLDTNGNRIQAHGGSIFYEKNTFYWYGENKEKTAPGNGILQWGVRCYSSKNLCQWKDEGLLIPPDTEHEDSLLHPSSKAERPHILFNERTGKYVCWIKVIREGEQIALVLTADSFFGPYEIVRNGFRPLGMCMGDFDLVQEKDGRGYLIFEKVHTDLICAELSEDYTDVTGSYSVIASHEQPPFVREAPAHFSYEGRHYLFTSGTTGYHPNPSEIAEAESLMGEWKVLGNAHPQDTSMTSYGSQICSVFKHPGKKNLYIALADRWMPYLRDMDPEAYDSGKVYEDIKNNFLWSHSKDAELQKKVKWTVPAPNTSLSDYVWLPVTFEDGVPVLHWRYEWSIDEFEDVKKMPALELDKSNYPLVVGSKNKRTFEDWENSGSSVVICAQLNTDAFSSKDIEWNVEDTDIAALVYANHDKCEVRGRTTGYTKVWAKLPDGSEASCILTVIDNMTRTTVQSLRLNTDLLYLEPGMSAELKAILLPRDIFADTPSGDNPNVPAKTMNTEVTWFSTDENVVKVTSGKVEAAGIGEADIVAISCDVGRKAVCHVKVLIKIPCADMKGSDCEYVELTEGEQKNLAVKGSNIRYISTYPFVADVDETGMLTAYSNSNVQGVSEDGLKVAEKPGWIEVLATSVSGGAVIRYQVSVKSKPKEVMSLTLSHQNICLDKGESLDITGVAGPSCVLGKQVIFESLNPEIVEITEISRTEDGHAKARLTGKKEGSTTLIASCDGKKAECLVEVVIGISNSSPQISAAATCADSSYVYLRDLHIPQETITENSVTLLWNRESLVYAADLDHYEVFGSSGSPVDTQNLTQTEKLSETNQLGYTAKGLNSGSMYTFRVYAVGKNHKRLAEAEITVRTKDAGEIINVLEAPFHAKGDGSVLDTIAIQKAINQCPAGGTVYLPENHIFCTGALFLKSNMNFVVDGILMGSPDPKDYPWVVSRWEGWRKLPMKKETWSNSSDTLSENTYVRASLLNLGVYDEGKPGEYGPFNIENVVIRGCGQINGNGFRLAYNEGPNQHNAGGGMPEPFSPILNTTLRGSLLRAHNARGIYVADLTFAYGPGWQIHPIYCQNMTFDHLNLISKGNGTTGAADDIGILNGDGIDPDSCCHVNIVNTFFYCNDDSVTIKSGRNREGNELQKPTAFLRVTDCISENSKAGFVAGSELASGCHDILMQNLTIRNMVICGLWIKTMRPRGGESYNLQYKDITIEGCGIPIRMALEYSPIATSAAGINPALNPPDIGQVVLENIRDLGGNQNGLQFVGLEDRPIHDFRFVQVDFTKSGKEHIFQHCMNFAFTDCVLK